jgi:hypothetical protein
VRLLGGAGLALLLVLAAACSTSAEPEPGPADPSTVAAVDPEPTAPGSRASTPLELGEWETYPTVAAEDDWPHKPIDGPRWAQVTAELACAGRRNRGDPDAHRQLLRNILSYHQTTLEEVASFSARLNRADPERAATWAVPVSEAIRGCR